MANQALDIRPQFLKTNKLSVNKEYKCSGPKLVGAKIACVPKVKFICGPLVGLNRMDLVTVAL